MPVIEPAPAAPVAPAGPCDWPLDTTCCPDFAAASPTLQTAATAWATQILDALTGRRFAQCLVNYRPCGPKCGGTFGYITWPVGAPSSNGGGMPWVIPYVDAGVWRNCICPGVCSCRARCEVPFPGPVAEVTEVKVDGVVIDPSAYRLDSFRGVPQLVRTDGDCWPDCQDVDADPGDVGAFVITYQPGEAVPLAGRTAAGMLACEFLKACQGQECALPAQLQSLTRNGIQVEVVDPASLLENGLTGIAMVDLWVRSVNPARKAQRSRVYSPDSRGPRFTL